MRLLVLATAGFAAFAVAFVRARGDFERDDHLTMPTFTWLFVAFVVLAGSILAAAYGSVWSLPVPAGPSTIVGATLAALGISLYLSARMRLRSFRATWGLTLERLVADGPYRLSRNPQATGAVSLLLGSAILGQSGAAVLMVLAYAIACLLWIRMEERVLERRFGAEYLRYRSLVPRFL